jgi:hypothetical protein
MRAIGDKVDKTTRSTNEEIATLGESQDLLSHGTCEELASAAVEKERNCFEEYLPPP